MDDVLVVVRDTCAHHANRCFVTYSDTLLLNPLYRSNPVLMP